MIKIKSITFFNHVIFKNQTFDFTIDGDNAVDNIIIAGENGIGKTKFLEELYNISNQVFFPHSRIYSQKTHEIIIDISDENYCDFNNENVMIKEAILTISKNESGQLSSKISFISNGNLINDVRKKNLIETIQRFKINGLYSNVDINYKPRSQVTGPNSESLDNSSSELPNDMAHEIIQLLVNISIEDSCDMASWVRDHRNETVPDDIYYPRLKRFTNAFKKMFDDTIEYKEIRKNSIPIFKKGDSEIEISALSSGEKQVIFRGAYLLKNKNSLKGVPVFIDEPEISMHPKWEENIFDYYTHIFSDESVQTSQIFIATHSEHILSKVLSKDNCLVIKIKDDSYDKFFKNGPGIILPSITISEIKYAIFDLYTTDFHSLLYGYIQENFVKDSNGNQIIEPNVLKTDRWLKTQKVTLKKYKKQLSSGLKEYDTLPTYIRNCIDHPDSTILYNDLELKKSIDELINVINNPI